MNSTKNSPDEPLELQVLILLDGEVVAEARAQLRSPESGPPIDQVTYEAVLSRRLDALAAITRPLEEEHGIRATIVWPPQDA